MSKKNSTTKSLRNNRPIFIGERESLKFHASIGFNLYQTLTEGVIGFDLSKGQKEQLLAHIHRSTSNRLLFIRGYVLPQIQYYPRKIASSPGHLSKQLGHVQGASGTLIENVPDCFTSHFDRKAIFRNLIPLWEKCQDRIHCIPKLEGKALIDHFFSELPNNFNVIIDAAGYFMGHLRGLNTGMSTSFVTIREDAKYIRQKLELPEDHKIQFRDLFLYSFNPEAENQGSEAFDVMHNNLLAEIEELFWRQDLHLSTKKRLRLLKKFAKVLSQDTFSHPIHSLRSKNETLPINRATEEKMQQLLNLVKGIVSRSDRKKLGKTFKALRLSPDRLRLEYSQTADSDPQISFSEVEEVSEEIPSLDRDYALNFKPAEPIRWDKPYWNLSQYQNVSTYHPKDKHFLNGILCTQNFFRIEIKKKSTLHRVTVEPARYFLIARNRETKASHIVLLDLHDVQYLLEQMQRDAEEKRIYSDTSDFYLVGSDHMNLLAENAEEPWSQELRELTLKARPYTGPLAFDREDLEVLTLQKNEREFFQSIERRFVTSWPHYKHTLNNLLHLVG